MKYYSITPKKDLEITQIYTIHYYENYKDYFFPGERHDFWEFVYIDRGEITVQTDLFPDGISLRQGSILFHRPNEFHSFYANDISAHNIVVMSFSSASPSMNYFKENPLHHPSPESKRLLNRILEEARQVFSTDLSDPTANQLHRSFQGPFAGEQLITLLLELFLILLIRQESIRTPEEMPDASDAYLAKDYVEHAIDFLKENITSKIVLADVCQHVNISRSHLQKIFRRQTGKTVMHFLVELRIDEAKFLIRNRNMDFTEISHKLCYSSVHHFSRQFKEVTGMTPTEYQKSIQSLYDHSFSHLWN